MPPVVPNAFGYGMNTRAAYAGSPSPTICIVDSLNPSGSGTVKDALELDEPRIIIPSVGGEVWLNGRITIGSPFCSFWGAPGPSPGITLKQYGVELTTNDVHLSHFRIRPGEYGQGVEDNCAFISFGNCHDFVLDHLSVAWGPDENIAFSAYHGLDIRATAWRCLSAECLDFPASVPLSASHGFLCQSSARKVSAFQNAIITNRERNPYIQSVVSLVFANNFVFNAFGPWWGFHSQADIHGNPGSQPWYTTFPSNVWKIGNNTDDDPTAPQAWIYVWQNRDFGFVFGNETWINDDLVVNNPGIPVTFIDNQLPYDPRLGAPPANAALAGFTIMPAADVEAFVLANAGARPLDRDAFDTRIFSDAAGGVSRGYRNHQDLYGDVATTPSSTTIILPSNPHDVQPSGYTNLEEWHFGKRDLVEGAGADVTPGVDQGGTTDNGNGSPYPNTGGLPPNVTSSSAPCAKSSAPAPSVPGNVPPAAGPEWESTCEGGAELPEAAPVAAGESWDAF